MNPFIKTLLSKNRPVFCFCSVRGFKPRNRPIRGKPHGEAKTLNSILSEMNKKDETIHYNVDIGLPYCAEPNKEESKRRKDVLSQNLSNKNLERSSRKYELVVPLEESFVEWLLTDGPKHIRRIAEHYGIFEHLFGEAYYHPVTLMSIAFKSSDDLYTPVFFGNTIKPKEAKNAPKVEIGNKDILHTLVLSNLDGHLNKENGEYVHWLVGNIPDGDYTKGTTVVPYLQPFPLKGTGYHRYVFVLYQHEKELDLSNLLKESVKENVPETRTFNTYNFYKERQDSITPTGLSFFQTEWDSSVKRVFHEIFKMNEPRYEYDFEPNYKNPQVWFPLRKAFDKYMDRYRDPKTISKEILVKKLKTHHPFQEPEPPLMFPNLHTYHDFAGKASWIQVRAKKERLGWGKPYNDNIDIIDPK